jgi:hypothetical protein
MLPPEDYLRVYELFRERVVQEDTLINYRMTWMIFSEAIIIALWGAINSQDLLIKACHQNPPDPRIYYVALALCATGILFAFGGWLTISAAKAEIAYIRDGIYNTKYKFIADDDRIPKLTGSAKRHSIWYGHIMGWGCPLLFVAVWSFFSLDVINTRCS